MESFQAQLNLWLARFGDAVPNIVGALLILLVGWLIAKALQKLTRSLLNKTDMDNRVARATTAGSAVKPERAIAKLVYYIVLIIAILAALDVLGINSVLAPLNNLVNDFLSFIPDLVGALLIGFIGYIFAKIVSGLVATFTGFLEGVSTRAGLDPRINLANILKTVVFILVFVPFLIAALDALSLDSITDPAKLMLAEFLNAIPNIFAAAIIIALFYLGGKFISGLLKTLLQSMGTDRLSERLELNSLIGSGTSLSGLLANIAFFFIMFFGIITGIEQLGFDRINYILTEILEVTGQIAFGLVILAIGNYLANLAYRTMSAGRSDNFIAGIARIVILGLFLAIGLRTMGIADDIVNLAFGLTLGAVAVAVALSFGLGGREAAGEQMRKILEKFNQDEATSDKGSLMKPSSKSSGGAGSSGGATITGGAGSANTPTGPGSPTPPPPSAG